MAVITPPPGRIVIILPCCIGDVVLGTVALGALRRAFPQAHIAWAAGAWSRAAIERHPDLSAVIDIGPSALPVKSLTGFARFVRTLRTGRFDLAISLVRSPLMSVAALLTGIPQRAGLDSAGRGFGYTVRAPIDPGIERHEAEIYLDVVRALGVDTAGITARIPPHADDVSVAQAALTALDVDGPFAVVNPAGGNNPGMALAAKRFPPDRLAVVVRGLQDAGYSIVLAGGPDDGLHISALQREFGRNAPPSLAGVLTLRQIGALASLSSLYVGNDTGLTHLAAASGARTAMIMGPSSPRRYAPFTPDSIAVWKPVVLPSRGVAAGVPSGWDWAQDGISPEEALDQILSFVQRARTLPRS
jgi:heptosyltransferase II